MPVLTGPQIATLQRVLAVTNNVLPRLEMLESIAQINLAMQPRVTELRQQREYLAQLATATLEIDRQLGGAATPTPVATTAGVSYTPPPPTYSPPPYSPPVFAGLGGLAGQVGANVNQQYPTTAPMDIPTPNVPWPVSPGGQVASLSPDQVTRGDAIIQSGNGQWYRYNTRGLPL